MKKFFKIMIDFFLSIILRILTKIIKKDNKIFLFGDFGGKRFGDNSKYLYLYFYKNKKRYLLKNIIWITIEKNIYDELKNKGYEVYYKYSLKSFYYHLKAKYHFVNQGEGDICGFLSRNSIRVNLWHGIPLKKIKYLCENSKVMKNYGGWENEYLLVCSKFGEKTLGKAFRINTNKMLKGLYPRVDFLLRDDYPIFNKEKKYIDKIKILKNKKKKILLYLPTFRENQSLKFLGEEEYKIINFFDFLEKNNYFLFTKLHFIETIKTRSNKEIRNKNFINIEQGADIYPILKEADILITDYSSVYFDYLALDKDIIFFPYDLEYYKNSDQGLIFDYEKVTPGDKVYNLDELIINLEKKLTSRDNFSNVRKELYKKCFENYSMEDTVCNILNIREEKNEF